MRVSVVIPTFNAGAGITALLDALRAQKPSAPDEIIAIDSGSTDDTRARVTGSGGRFVELTRPFNHGLARDEGIAAATGELIFLTVQDALPAAEDCLARFARHFEDARVAGVSSRQVPPADGPAELKIKAEIDVREMYRRRPAGQNLAGETPAVQAVSLGDHPEYASYSPEEQVELYRFDNVGAMIRRSVWETIHFGACDYAEDLLWAKRALEAGHTLVRDFSAPIVHAHRRSFGYEFRRGLLDARVMDELFGFRYRFFKKMNRVAMLARSGSAGRSEAFKTYAAHALARMVYGGYRIFLRPMGVWRGTVERWTKGI
ncbi:MAG TPA: glycosyltransferase family 2 protein [Planctomycetota bacterium]|nr:glycosyltransferase family 2 protein [Planctomycetota bacterium]